MTEPISHSELKKHLRLSEYVETPAEAVSSIAIAEHTVGAVTGSAVSVLYERASVVVTPGAITAGSEITIKIQDSYAETTGYADWYTFPVQDDTWSDILTKEYTGQKSYIRAIATVAEESAVFGASVNIMDAENAEDEYLTDLIQAARGYLESRTRRALITRTETYAIHDFPDDDEFIEIPFGNLQSVDSIIYTDDEGAETTMAAFEYRVEDRAKFLSRIYPAYGSDWPEYNPPAGNNIVITFTCGYGTSADDVPSVLKRAILMICSDWYHDRGEIVKDARTKVFENPTVDRIIKTYTLKRYL